MQSYTKTPGRFTKMTYILTLSDIVHGWKCYSNLWYSRVHMIVPSISCNNGAFIPPLHWSLRCKLMQFENHNTRCISILHQGQIERWMKPPKFYLECTFFTHFVPLKCIWCFFICKTVLSSSQYFLLKYFKIISWGHSSVYSVLFFNSRSHS